MTSNNGLRNPVEQRYQLMRPNNQQACKHNISEQNQDAQNKEKEREEKELPVGEKSRQVHCQKDVINGSCEKDNRSHDGKYLDTCGSAT
ncbi:hypothetical protein RDI58_007490 [Solanum bulbocastanum]|uniref:Uncharacterized protein n=1 Tax=Solanum bulbocastanum TaxID=147425 RepID=A0AAN8YIY0_SOLBU